MTELAPRIGNASLRRDAEAIFRAGLAAVEPRAAVLDALALEGTVLVARGVDGREVRVELDGIDSIWVVGAGKASATMALGVEDVLGERLAGGLVVVKDGYAVPTSRVEIVLASHPEPDARGVEAARRVMALAEQAGANDLVVALVSGGGSALLPLPALGLSLDDVRAVTKLLLGCGAPIDEINAVRKRLSAIQGGRLARAAMPATLLSLIVSDVVGDPLASIASGPTVPDAGSTVAARRVLERHALWDAVPAAVRQHLSRVGDEAAETPVGRVHNLLVASNRRCLEACAAHAATLGYEVVLEPRPIVGEARDRGAELAAWAMRCRDEGLSVTPPACLVAGGETTVHIRGAGKGGRNQELALAAALALEGAGEGLAVLSAGTDGTDHVDEAAGAMAYPDSVERGRAAGVDAAASLADNDSFAFFSAVGDHVVTGPTGTNVMDVHLVLVA